mgnify:CR=1 FL=1
MDLTLSDEQRLLYDQISRFAADELNEPARANTAET